MNITPDTNIRLLKCPIKLDNKNQITFASLTAQETYFLGLSYVSVDGSMYQRKDSSIYYPDNYDDLVEYSYVMYQNENYSSKWFYAFITGMEYINDNMTKISIMTDCFQTWQFDLTYKTSFVEREMIGIAADTPGANLVPENLETGEYKIAATADVTGLNPYYVWAYTDNSLTMTEGGTVATWTNFLNPNGIPASCTYLVATSESGYAYIYNALQVGNQSEKVVAHFTVPSLACNANLTRLVADGYADTYRVSGSATTTSKTLLATPSSLDGYTPKNNKVRQYPYVYVGFNPPQGNSKIFRYEDFTSGTPSFKFISEINPNPTVYMIPQNYRGKTGDCTNDSATLNGYPQLASRVDVYNSWVAENTGIISVQQRQTAANMTLDLASQTAGMLGNIASIASGGSTDAGALGGFATGALNMYKTAYNYDYYIAMINAQKEKQAMLPDNVSLGGSNATLLGYSLMDDNIFTRYNIKYQFAKRIDDYFSMYGYQTNELKVPNINNRPYWNYVKTQGINITGNIPNEDLEIIKTLFNSGITLWHNPTYFLDYSRNNKETT